MSNAKTPDRGIVVLGSPIGKTPHRGTPPPPFNADCSKSRPSAPLQCRGRVQGEGRTPRGRGRAGDTPGKLHDKSAKSSGVWGGFPAVLIYII